MRFFTEDVEAWGADEDKFREACELNHIEYLKAKKRLPKKFIDIYEKTVHFDDDPIPCISIITEWGSFTHGIKGGPPSFIKMVIVDYDNHDLAWEIIISNIKEMTAKWAILPSNSSIDCIDRDELIVDGDKDVSWELNFVGGLNLKVVFRNIDIRELKKDEIEIYKQPVKYKKRKRNWI